MKHTATRDLQTAKLIIEHSKELLELEQSLTSEKFKILMEGVTGKNVKYRHMPEVIKTDEYFGIKPENNFFQNAFGYLKKAFSKALNTISNEGNIYEEEFRPVKIKIDAMITQYQEKWLSQVGIDSPTQTRMSPLLLAEVIQDKIDRDKIRPLEDQKYKYYSPLVIDAYGGTLKKAIYEQLVAQSGSNQLDLIIVVAGEGHVVPVTLRKDDNGAINAYYFEAAGDQSNLNALRLALQKLQKKMM